MKFWNEALQYLKKNRNSLLRSLFYVTLCNWLCNGYAFCSTAITGDSVAELYNNWKWKFMIGRPFNALYRLLFLDTLAVPWWVGILSTIWIALSLFLIIKMLKIHSKLVQFLTAAILCVNVSTVSICATFIHDFDADMFGLLLAVLAAFLWHQSTTKSIWHALFATGLVSGATGIYQPMISVTVGLMMIVSIQDILAGKETKAVLIKGFYGIGIVLLGGVLYMGLIHLAAILTHTEFKAGDYNSVQFKTEPELAGYLLRFGEVWKTSLLMGLGEQSGWPSIFVLGLRIVLFLCAAISIAGQVLNRHLNKSQTLLIMVLVLLLPFGLNASQFISDYSHQLTLFPVCFLTIFALIVLNRKDLGMLGIVALCLVLVGNVNLASRLYFDKIQNSQATNLYLNRVLNRIESTPGYVQGETPVVLVGFPPEFQQSMKGMEEDRAIYGFNSDFGLVVTMEHYYQHYFHYVFHNFIRLADKEDWDKFTSTSEPTENWPDFPDSDSIRWEDGVLVVKLGV